MIKHKILLPDGTTLTSGTGTINAIRSVQLTEQVNAETDLCPGAACAASAQIELWAPENGLAITQGDSLTLFRTDSATGQEEPVGIFLAEKPVKSSANVYKITAYDRMILLDKDLSTWLRDQQSAFPMALTYFIRAVCGQCGVTLEDDALTDLPNASYQIQAFYADSLTGRQLIQWAAQAAGRFARMTPAGELTFGWFTAQGLTLTPQQYLQGSLQYEDYETAAIDKVQIRQSDSDVGVIYPPDAAGDNALVIQGNLLLTAENAEQIRPIAQSLYTLLQGIRYTPLSVSLYVGAAVPAPGTIVTVLDAHSRQLTTYVMQRSISGQKVTLTATGNARRDGTSAVNNQKWENLQGKILEIQADVDGLQITASDLAGGMASLNLTVDGLRTEVSGKLGEAYAKTMIEQGLESLTLTAESDAEAKDIKGDAQWADMGGNATVTDGVLTIVGTTQESIASLYVPADNLPGLGGRKITYTFEYKVNETVSGEACDVILWYDYQNEAGGGYYVLRITTGPGDTAQPTDWTPVSWTIEMKRDTIKKLQFAASIKKNAQGSVSIRNVGITTEAESNSSTLVLRAGGTELSSTQVKITGVVTFADLSGSGTTVINGDNIKTGTIQGTGGSNLWSLDSGTLISGISDTTHAEINFNGIRWYSSNYLTGVLYSEYGKTYLGSNSTYTFLGWFSSGYPSISANKQKYDDNFGGLYYDHGSRLIHCVAEKFEIPGRIECESLSVNGREI